MQEKEIKETNAVEEISYEQALREFKAQWKDKKKEQAIAKRKSEKEEKRSLSVEACKKALEELKNVDSSFNRELAPVVKRLEMFINGERYSRNK